MALSYIKETIELSEVTTDGQGNAYINKRINLKEGYVHQLIQVDMYEDAFMTGQPNVEIVISPYPAIPTNMDYGNVDNRRYPAAGDDSVLYKERRQPQPNLLSGSTTTQFPSSEIAAANTATFYTDHVYINMHIMTNGSSVTITNIAFSVLLVLNDKKVSNLEHTLGVMAESHDAMCALLMSNGHMVSRADLRGNVFPMWRYGGIRAEHMVSDSFFLPLNTTDEEPMASTTFIRGAVSAARKMQPFDEPFGDFKYPDWIRMDLNQGITTGPIRPDPIPLRYADNGNTRMF